MMNNSRIIFLFVLLAFCMPVGCFAQNDITLQVTGFCSPSCMVNGKMSLEMGEYDKALVYLTAAHEEMPFLDDYILFWRAGAFAGKADYGKALDDIRSIRTSFPDSPLMKSVRLRELELAQKTGEKDIDDLFRKFISDYPSESTAKFAYASLLKSRGDIDKAKAIYRELFISVTPFSKSAGEELSPSEIKASDLLSKGKNLNNAWLFREAEKQFREALKRKDSKPIKKDLTEGLAYSLFRQKKYKEAAGYYSDSDNRLWKAKALFRAGDMDRFETEIKALGKKNDKRIASLLLAYGSKKRRLGQTDEAITIFRDVAASFNSFKEDALWHEGWTYFRNGDYGKALDIFTSLYAAYSDTRYLYWKNRCLELLGSSENAQAISLIPNNRSNNFYMFINSMKKGVTIPSFEGSVKSACTSYQMPKRVTVLEDLGLKNEARTEVTFMANRNISEKDITCLSAYLENVGDFKTSISFISRLPYREELHELYYPPAFIDIVNEASRNNSIDPLLVMAIMREESRFAPDARSVAGALGLMQLMPKTALKLNKSAKASMKQSADLYDARTNVLIGSYYLKSLVTYFDSVPLAVAAYNAGEDAVKGWLAEGNYKSADEFIEDIPYDETRNYVKRVLTSYFEYLRQTGKKEIPATLLKKGNL